MKNNRSLFLLLPLFLLLNSGCLHLPQLRIFQKKVPTPIIPIITEAMRETADLIARKIETPVELKAPAIVLSASLGSPDKPIQEKTIEKSSSVAVEKLQAGETDKRKKQEKQNSFLNEYEGKNISGTGFNLFGPLAVLGPIGLLAIFVFVPGSLGVCLWFIRRLRGTVSTLAQGVENYREENPEAIKALEDQWGRLQDRAHKSVVKFEKSRLIAKGLIKAT